MRSTKDSAGRPALDASMAARISDMVEARSREYDAIAKDIWEHPELSHEEERSSRIYRERLASRGFTVTEFPEMPHSFVAERGSGGPIIAFMGEYDALPGLSQTCSVSPSPAVPGAPGHACGHNLLGAGSLAAAEALADALAAAGKPGRVRYYGCPAEESLGRIPLVKAGRFDDVDIALTWHPADVNTPHHYMSSANINMVFTFTGRASHAGMAPHAGRSALDAAQLFNLSLEFMREHLPRGVLLHYVISDGGAKPNIVPARAATWLYIRAPRARDVREVVLRVTRAARGACLMTDTTFTRDIKAGKCDFIPNDVIHDALGDAMRAIPPPAPTETETDFARALRSTVAPGDREATLTPIGAPTTLLRDPLHGTVGDFGRGFRIGGSLDTGDVSYIVPTGQMNSATWPLGVGAHTWQSCAASGSPWAFRAMRWAGACLAAAGWAFATDPKMIARAKHEHSRKKLPYRSTMDI